MGFNSTGRVLAFRETRSVMSMMQVRSRSIKRKTWLYKRASELSDSSRYGIGKAELSRKFRLVGKAVNGVYGVWGTLALCGMRGVAGTVI